jgi:hypothetical protein
VAARALLIDGQFDEASRRFATLARSATNATDRAVAVELGSVAAGWAARRLAQRSEAETSEAHHDRRSADEIASLYLNSVIYGLGTGAFIAVQVRPTSPSGIILPALLLGGGAAGVVAAIDSGDGLGYGVPQSIISGMYLGLGEGIVWTLWNQARAPYYEEWSDKTIASVIWSSATLGAVAGGALGNAYGATPGRASYVGSIALWSGLATGLVTGALVKDDEHADDNGLLAGAIAMNAGAVAGILTAHGVSPSIARVRFLDLGAISGGLVFGGMYLSAAGQNPHPQTALGFTALGVGAGFATAWYMTSGMKKDTNRSDAPAHSVNMTVMPLRGGLGLSAYGFL